MSVPIKNADAQIKEIKKDRRGLAIRIAARRDPRGAPSRQTKVTLGQGPKNRKRLHQQRKVVRRNQGLVEEEDVALVAA